MDRPEEFEFATLMLIGIALTFFLAMSVVVFVVYYQRKLFAQQAAMEQLKLEEQQKRLEAVMTTQENERARIAQDLHDEVGVMLSTVKLYITAGDREHHAEGMLDEAVDRLRAISQDLSSEHLMQFGLGHALQATASRVEDTGALAVNVDYRLPERLPQETEVQLYRICQEMLNNTLKHARATAAQVEVCREHENVRLTYRDNGIGFDPQSRAGPPGLGLQTLSGRVQFLHGDLQLHSAPQQGIKVNITIPQ